jgi:hypothetical protein
VQGVIGLGRAFTPLNRHYGGMAPGTPNSWSAGGCNLVKRNQG